MLVLPVSAQEVDWSVARLVREQALHKKNLRPQDVYKLLYQHLMRDTAAARVYLEEELAGADTSIRGEELMERISTDGRMVRINLRPYKRLNLPPALLVHCMILSSSTKRPDTAAFVKEWDDFVSAVRGGLLPWSEEEVREWDQRVQGRDFTPVHHSAAYAEANTPAYRVVLKNVIEPLLEKEGIHSP
jgi:hypothetical protein